MSAKPKSSPTIARSPHQNREMRKETSTTKQTSKLLIPMSTKPKSSPTTTRSPRQNREMRKEVDPSSIIHHPSSTRFRQPKAKKVERERVLDEIVKRKRERKSDLEKKKKENLRKKESMVRLRKRKESKTLLLTVDVNSVCVEGLDWSFPTRCGCVWYFLIPRVVFWNLA